MKVVTPIQYMNSLKWSLVDLIKAEEFINEWDKKPDSFYKSKSSEKFDKAEKEHYRNCIKFWKVKLNEAK